MDEVEEIKRRLDIVDFISTYLTLKKAGANYKALCPFHQEKTPSFMVSPEKQIFKCFGCGEAGDVFSFVMKMENLEFPEALRLLAERAGVQLKRPSFAQARESKLIKDRKTRLYQINDLSAKVFNKILLEHSAGKPAREYLKKRGITVQTIQDFQIGYAPNAQFLERFLAKKGFKPAEIQEAGAPNRFFRRIMFPIKDVMGNTIAFTGRVLDPKQEPKYLNTADTIIFHKGRILYNLNQARGPIKQAKATIVVEGQMDVVASHQAGVKNVVATSGTALTLEHLQILYRYTPNIIFAFDSDNAGLATAKKAYEMAIREGFNVRMVNLGEFKDPGEMIAQSPRLWQEAVQNALPVIDWYFELAFSQLATNNQQLATDMTSQQKKEIAREILPIIKIIPDEIEQAHYVNLLAKKLAVSEEIIFSALAKVGLKKEPASSVKPSVKPKPSLTAEELLIAILLFKPEKIKESQAKIQPADFKNPRLRAIYNDLIKEYNKDSQNITPRLLKRLPRELSVYISNLIFEAENLYAGGAAELNNDLNQAIKHLQEAQKEALKSYYAAEIQKAEAAKDHAKLKKLIKEFQAAISKSPPAAGRLNQ
jgi:DNA primase